MRIFPLVAALAAVTAFVVPAEAATAPPPASCSAVVHGLVVPANPGGVVATAAVATYGAEVVCERDLLTTPPIDHASSFQGDLSIELRGDDGSLLCGGWPLSGRYDSISSVLVMAQQNTCVLPVTDPRRLQGMYVRAFWATMPVYSCCAEAMAGIAVAAGAGVKP